MTTSFQANSGRHGIGEGESTSLTVRPAGLGSSSRQASSDRGGVTGHAVGLVVSAYRSFVIKQKLRRFRKTLESSPDSVPVLSAYANYLESQGMRSEAAGIHGRLVTIFRRQKEADHAAVYCRKLDAYGSPDAERCYREVAALYSELQRFEDAAKAAKRVVELYLSESQHKAAAGYVRQLPTLGPRSESTRAELLGLIEGNSTATEPRARPQAPTAGSDSGHSGELPPPSSYSTRPLPPSPAPQADDVFLTGHMGRITPFDVVQIVESNALTGLLEFQTLPMPGAIFFRDGRIVAAISGSKRGYLALRAVFTAEPGPFRVIITDEVPEDEFAARSNTGLVLDVLREIDEATEKASPELVRPGQDDFFR